MLPPVSPDLRLASISYRLATRNSDRCQTPDRLTGMLIHDRAAYDERDRPLIAARFGLGEGFGVRDLVPGSAADRAGIRRGDEIVEINGIALDAFERDLIGTKASSERSEAFEAALDDALRQGPVALGVRREGARLSLHLAADPGCGGHSVLVPENDFDAWSDGGYIAVTSRMLADTPDDAELAFVIAHEMSHNILRHQEKLQGRSALLAQFGVGAGRVKDTEVEADRFAIGLLARADYDLGGPVRFLTEAARKRPFDIPITHPGLKRRISIAAAEIARLQVAPPKTPAVAVSDATFAGQPIAVGGAGLPAPR